MIPGRRTRIARRFAESVLFILLSSFGFASVLPINPSNADLPSSTEIPSTSSKISNFTLPIRALGADPLPNLSLPRTRVSTIDDLVGAGSVLQDSDQNVTIRNSRVTMRLVGTPSPHDMLLSQDYRVLSSNSSWVVQLLDGTTWVDMTPISNNFSVIGTNRTGAFLIRTMQIHFGQRSGLLKIVYKAISAGPLKWTLQFTPDTPGQYRLSYVWGNINSFQLLSASKQLRAIYQSGDYTFDWNDVPASFSTRSNIAANRFSFSLDLGLLLPRSTATIDPSIIGGSTILQATEFTTQRKVFFEPKGGYYFVFYDNGTGITYRYSHDGATWSPGRMPTGWPAFVDNVTSSVAIANSGQQIIMATGDKKTGVSSGTVSLRYSIGTISGPLITWTNASSAISITPAVISGTQTFGIRYVNVALSAGGNVAFSYNWYLSGWSNSYCSPGAQTSSESGVFFLYNSTSRMVACNWAGSRHDGELDKSIVVPYDSTGRMRVIYQFPSGSLLYLQSNWFDGLGHLESNAEVIDGGKVSSYDEFSAVVDPYYVAHVIYKNGNDYNITYAFRGLASQSWSWSKNIFGLYASAQLSWPTTTLDSANNLYAFASCLSSYCGGSGSVIMRIKPAEGTFSDGGGVYPITSVPGGPAYLGSNPVSGGSVNETNIQLIWTQSGIGQCSPYCVMFASIPIQTVWSPYSSPTDPWDGSGLAPYGQYFSNLGEYVTPSSGMLTITQGDLSVPGRSLSLDLRRVYAEPYIFLNNQPLNYENYPWAPLGNGWQLNFPWMSTASKPAYLHLGDGQGYRIPSTFWNGNTASYDNHQGVHFRVVRYMDGSITVSTSSSTAYNFDASHRLSNITDATNQNFITLTYNTNNLISKITDTVGRTFLFCYTTYPYYLHSVNQTTGISCSTGSGSIRGIVFGQNAQKSLTNVTDPAGRITRYSYDSTGWLVTKITYPTSWYDAYSYSAFASGTQGIINRVSWQRVNATQTSPIRSFKYTYTLGTGDSVNNSTVAAYDGTSNIPSSYTSYRFSFAGTIWNVTDSNHNLIRGVLQTFDVHGEIPKETVMVYDSSGLGWPPGSYTNYYRYDLWGNLIYSKRNILLPTQPYDKGPWYHESFKSYYNNGEPPGFYAFQDSFSQNQGFASDNSWNVTSGYWLVSNGIYNGTETTGAQENMVSTADVGSSDLSMQTRMFVGRQVNRTLSNWNRVGIFGHYAPSGSNSYKWALVLANQTGTGRFLNLLDETNSTWAGSTSCNWSYGVWYMLNLTIHGLNAWGSLSGGGLSCTVTGTFSNTSHAVTGTRFGLYAGSYSALFDDVRVTTVSPQITTNGFTNDFSQSGAPGPIGLNTWLTTTKPPQPGWNTSTTTSWLPASSWSIAYPSQNYGAGPWGTIPGWPDSNAQWIWWDAYANVSGSADPVWFRRGFNVSATTNVNISIVSDNTYVLYLDGTKLGSQLILNNWQQVGSYPRTLTPGYHVLAINATNPDGPDAAGLLVSVKNTDSGQIMFRSDNTAGRVIVSTAGTAEFQNVTRTTLPISIENYNSYFAWGGLNQTRSGHGGSAIVDDSYASTQPSIYWTMSPSSNIFAQPFANRATATFVFQANFTLDKQYSPSGPMYAEVWSKTGSPATMLAKSTPIDASVLTTTFQKYTFTFPEPLAALSSGTSYYIAIDASSVDLSGFNQINVQADSTTGTRGNPCYRSANSSWSCSFVGWTFSFAVLVQNWLTTSRTYDSYGNTIMITDSKGNSTSYTYSPTYQNAFLTMQSRTIIPGGTQAISSYGYNFTMGTKIWSQEPKGYGTSGYNTTYRYDILGRLTKATLPNGDYTSYNFNDVQNYVDIMNENGWHTRQVYDGLARLIVSEKFLGTSTSNQTTTYNWQDKPLTQTDQLGHTYHYQYDAIGRLVQTTKPDGNFTQIQYNDVRSWVRSIDETNTYRGYRYDVYDRLGRLIERDDPGNGFGISVGIYNYDEVGNLASTAYATSAASPYQPTTYSYDNMNRLLTTAYNDTTSETFSYDSNGNLVKKIDRNGIKTLYSYDSLNRVNIISYCRIPITSDSYSYDVNGNLLQLQNSNTTLTYTYDIRNRVLSEKYDVNLATRPVIDLGCFGSGGQWTTSGGTTRTYTVPFSYSGEVRTGLVYPTTSIQNIAVNYTYDGMGRIATVYSPYVVFAKFSYFQNDLVKGIQYGNGLVANYTYDSLNRVVTEQVSNNKLQLTYSYDNVSTVATVKGKVNQVTVNEAYTYDPLRRLTNATIISQGNTHTLWYTYDYTGNRLQQSDNGAVTNYNYNATNNELKSSTTTGTNISYSYDSNGNLATRTVTSGGTTAWAYTWDVANHLLKVTSNGSTQGAYAYDANGRMIDSISSSKNTFYAYAGTEMLWQNGTDFIYANGMKIAWVIDTGGFKDTSTRYYHTDQLGSVRLATKNDASVYFTDNYQPFGQDNGTPTGGQSSPPFKFTGKPYYSGPQLYYYYHRWYDASTGRFISQDLLRGDLNAPQSLNSYTYVSNTPTTLLDPSGLFGLVLNFPRWNPFPGLPPILAQVSTAGPYGAALVAGAYGIYVGGELLIGALAPRPTVPSDHTPAPTTKTTDPSTLPTPPAPSPVQPTTATVTVTAVSPTVAPSTSSVGPTTIVRGETPMISFRIPSTGVDAPVSSLSQTQVIGTTNIFPGIFKNPKVALAVCGVGAAAVGVVLWNVETLQNAQQGGQFDVPAAGVTATVLGLLCRSAFNLLGNMPPN